LMRNENKKPLFKRFIL